ncbi:hypothetical protein OSTOST_04385 [Ostertagia ostertagi]
MLGEAVDRQIIVDGVYDKQELDIDTPELLQEVGEYGESIDHSLHDAYADEAEQERHGDDPYGGSSRFCINMWSSRGLGHILPT